MIFLYILSAFYGVYKSKLGDNSDQGRRPGGPPSFDPGHHARLAETWNEYQESQDGNKEFQNLGRREGRHESFCKNHTFISYCSF